MSQFNYYPAYFKALHRKLHNIAVGGDTLRARLITSAFDPTDDTWSDVSADQVATGGGYTSGGLALTVTFADVVDNVFRVVITSPEWIGSGSGFSFRSMVILNDTAPADELIACIDFGRTISVGAGESTKTLLYTAFNEIDGLIIFSA